MGPFQLHLEGSAQASPGKDASPRWLADLSCQDRGVEQEPCPWQLPRGGGEDGACRSPAADKRQAGVEPATWAYNPPADISSLGLS